VQAAAVSAHQLRENSSPTSLSPDANVNKNESVYKKPTFKCLVLLGISCADNAPCDTRDTNAFTHINAGGVPSNEPYKNFTKTDSLSASAQADTGENITFDSCLHPLQIKCSQVIHKISEDLSLTAAHFSQSLKRYVPPSPSSICSAISNIQSAVSQLFELNFTVSSCYLSPKIPDTAPMIASNFREPWTNILLVGDNILNTVKKNDIDHACQIQNRNFRKF
jgi:hypothetical protein